MNRRLFNILSGLSLLLCVAMIVLWILSIWVTTWWGPRLGLSRAGLYRTAMPGQHFRERRTTGETAATTPQGIIHRRPRCFRFSVDRA